MSNTSRNGTSRQGAIHLVRIYEPDAERQVKALTALLHACTDPPAEVSGAACAEAPPCFSDTASAPEAVSTPQEAGKGHEDLRRDYPEPDGKRGDEGEPEMCLPAMADTAA